MNENRPRLPFDFILDELQIRDLLGSGGFGMTYLAYDWRDQEWVAVKEYSPFDLATRGPDGISLQPASEEHVENFNWGMDMFINEAMCLAAFEHEAIANVKRFFRANGTAYIAMEYIHGARLSDLLEGPDARPMSEGFVRKILESILDGLEQVHDAGFLHRDIKPSNILIRHDRMSPVLIDFGSARQAVANRSRDLKAVASRYYAPPEQYSEKVEMGPWTDIYALACVAYQCLSGDKPIDATDRLNGDKVPPLSKRLRSQASPGFLLAIDHGMELESAKRPRSIVEWRGELFGGNVPGRRAALDETIDFVKSRTSQQLTAQPAETHEASEVTDNGMPAVGPHSELVMPDLSRRKGSSLSPEKKRRRPVGLYLLLCAALTLFGASIALYLTGAL